MNKKKIGLKIVAIIMIILSIRGIYFVVTKQDFSFTGLPMYAIYLILCAVIITTLLVLWLAFIKKERERS